MKLNRKWMLVLALVLSVAMATGGTLAYLTDRDTVENTFTMGNVDIEVDENYEPDSELNPGVEVEKEAGIKNVHNTSDAWVWMTVSVPNELKDYVELTWLSDEIKAEAEANVVTGVHPDYTSYVVKYPKKLAPGKSTPDYLQGVTLSNKVDYQDGKYVVIENGEIKATFNSLDDLKIIVDGFAMQTEGFKTVEEAYSAYTEQWGGLKGGDSGATTQTQVKTIKSKADLLALAGTNAEGTYELLADINMNGEELKSIGVTYNKNLVINGNGHTISNVTFASGKQNGMTNIGMFYVETGASLTVNDLTVKNAQVEDGINEYTIGAALVGYANQDSTVNLNNVDVLNADITNKQGNAALLVGYTVGKVNLTDCKVTGTAVGEKAEKTGAFIGTANGAGCVVTFDNCSNNTNMNNCGRVINGATVGGKATVAVSTADKLIEELEAGNNVRLKENVKIEPASMSNAYGTTGINIKNGQAIYGNNCTIDIAGAGGTWDSGINTTGGLIKDVTVTGSFRGIFINHNSTHSERVVLENVTIDGTTYTISCDQGMNQGLTATDSTFNGWTSYAATLGDAEFINCNFGEGNGYAFCRPYAPTTFTNCNFESGYKMDPRAAVTLENCYLNGVLITADNLETLVTSNIANATVK